jgi:hypothetical protein
MYRLAACLILPVLLGGFRHPPRPLPAPEPVIISVIDREQDRELTDYRHRGERWIVGTPGHRYALRLYNRSDRRVLVVLSVDGVNAITGQTAAPDQTGYVLEPWQTSEITGWRKSQAQVAQFVFAPHRASYASRTGRPKHVGVIGAAVFSEAPPARPDYQHHRPLARDRYESNAAAREAAPATAPSRSQQLGTGHGEREWSATHSTTFERANTQPEQMLRLRYDSHDQLVTMGVIAGRRKETWPNPFPGGFVPDPPDN